MNQEELLKALEEDARKEREKLLQEAEEEARRIIAEAQQELKRLKEEDLMRWKTLLATERARALTEAKAYGMALLLEARYSILQEVFQRAEEGLEGREDYPDVLRRLILEALEDEKGEVIAFVSGCDLPILQGMNLPAGVEVRAGEVHLGVVITTRDGRRRVVNTLKSRLEKAKSSLMPILNEMLFKRWLPPHDLPFSECLS